MTGPVVEEQNSIKARLTALIEAVLEESKFDPVVKRVISKMILNFLKNARDSELKAQLEKLRDEIIPFILQSEEVLDVSENSHQDG